MRDVKATRSSPARPLDEVSDHMGQILRHADELLAEWAKFGEQVRGQVDRETQQIGNAVAMAVDDAVERSVATTAANVDRAVTQAMAERVGAQLQSLTAELARLEGRAKAASRLIAEQRGGDRKILWGVVAGIAIANVLLVLLVLLGLRKPAAPEVAPQAVPIVEPRHADDTKVETPSVAGSDTADKGAAGAGSADDPKAPREAKDVKDSKDPPPPPPAGSDSIRGAHGAPARKR